MKLIEPILAHAPAIAKLRRDHPTFRRSRTTRMFDVRVQPDPARQDDTGDRDARRQATVRTTGMKGSSMADKMYISAPFGGNQGPTALPLCRISYAQGLHKANDDGKFAVTLLFPKADLKVLQSKVAEVVTNQWGEKGIERFKQGLIKNPLLDGADPKVRLKKTDGSERPGITPETVVIRPWTKKPVPVFGANALPIDPTTIKSGWWGYPILTAFAWHEASNGDGVGFWIGGWMHSKEDEVLGGDGTVDAGQFFKGETVTTSGEGDVSGGAASLFG